MLRLGWGLGGGDGVGGEGVERGERKWNEGRGGKRKWNA